MDSFGQDLGVVQGTGSALGRGIRHFFTWVTSIDRVSLWINPVYIAVRCNSMSSQKQAKKAEVRNERFKNSADLIYIPNQSLLSLSL